MSELRYDDHLKLTEIVAKRILNEKSIKFLEDLYSRYRSEKLKDVIDLGKRILLLKNRLSKDELNDLLEDYFIQLDEVRNEVHNILIDKVTTINTEIGDIHDSEWLILPSENIKVVKAYGNRVDDKIVDVVEGIFCSRIGNNSIPILDSKLEIKNEIDLNKLKQKAKVEVTVPCRTEMHGLRTKMLFSILKDVYIFPLLERVAKGNIKWWDYYEAPLVIAYYYINDCCDVGRDYIKCRIPLEKLPKVKNEEEVERIVHFFKKGLTDTFIEDFECSNVEVEREKDEIKIYLDCAGIDYHLEDVLWDVIDDSIESMDEYEEIVAKTNEKFKEKFLEDLEKSTGMSCEIVNPMYHHGGIDALIRCKYEKEVPYYKSLELKKDIMKKIDKFAKFVCRKCDNIKCFQENM